MLTLEAIKKKLEDMKLKTVAEKAGISYPSVLKVVNGDTTHISYDVVKKLSDYLEGK